MSAKSTAEVNLRILGGEQRAAYATIGMSMKACIVIRSHRPSTNLLVNAYGQLLIGHIYRGARSVSGWLGCNANEY